MAAIFQSPKMRKDPMTGEMVQVVGKDGKPVFHPHWRARIVDHRGNRKTYTLSKNKQHAQAQADRIEVREKEIRQGLRPVPSVSELASGRDIMEVMHEYLDWGDTQGGRGGRPWSPTNSRKRRFYLKWWRETLKLKTLSDLYDCLPSAEKAIRSLGCKSGKTFAAYKEGLFVFCNWCKDRKYLTENPLDGMGKFDMRAKTPRRSMVLEEITALFNGSPEHRRLLYETAFASGFRAGELRSLTPDHVYVEKCGLHLDADADKGRKERFQPLSRELVDKLVVYGKSGDAKRHYTKMRAKAGAAPDLNVPNNPLLYVPSHPARVIQEDLKKVGVEIATSKGKLDFHACRKAYINLVIATGADVKTTQALSRHSTPYLTMEVYAEAVDTRLINTAELVGNMLSQAAAPIEIVPDTQKWPKSAQVPKSTLSDKTATPCIARGCIQKILVPAGGIEPPTYGL